MKVLITGSSGYIGYVLARFLTGKGERVVGLDVAPNPAWQGDDRFRFRVCDVPRKDALAAIFREEAPTHVIHLALLMNPFNDVRREAALAVRVSINVVEAA